MENWAWVDGEALLGGVDLETLPTPRLISALTATYVRFAMMDEDHRKVYNRVVLEMTRLEGDPTVTDEGEFDPSVFGLREGPVGTI